ncbi:hypothetical protein [Cellulomonas fimi]|uniref:hypothetical protein n=1 Tax=Cellulomonas fimi TaxID=1708 RepID=UPI0023595EB8|nr:hypothetical protein [Cellulomonas fimi]
MAREDTPAGRLHALLVEMRGRSNTQLRGAWAPIFRCEPADTSALVQGVVAVLALPDETEAAVRRLPNVDHDLLLGWRARVDAAMSIAHQLETTVENFKAQYTEVDTMLLQVVADQLDRNEPPVHMEADAVAQAADLVGQLLDALEAIDDEDARGLLVRHALRLQAALRLFKVSGAEGVREALLDSVAALSAVSNGRPEADERKGVRKYWELIAFVANAFTIAGTAYQLAPGVASVVKAITQ